MKLENLKNLSKLTTDKIGQLVKKLDEEDLKDWQYHILPVIKYAKLLAKKYKVDENIVELAAILHDT